jgi:apolipoprotein N-acyltransferase
LRREDALKTVSRWWRAGLCLLCGGLCVLAFAPFHLWPLAYLAQAGLFAIVQHATSVRAAAAAGAGFGLGLNLAGVSWVYVSLHDVGGMPAWMALLAVFGFSAYLAVYPALAAALAAWLARGNGVRFVLAAPAAWTLGEWLKATVFTGFPWLNLAYAQVDNPVAVGVAPLFGAYAVSASVALVSAALAGLLNRPAARGRALLASLIAAPVLLGWGLSGISWTEPAGPPITVSLLQGNVAQSLKWRAGEKEKALDNYRALAMASSAQLIILPETALPFFAENLPADYLSALGQHARNNGGDVLVGVVTRRFRDNGFDYYNSARSVGTAAEQTYSKVHLVPFGEFVPPLFGWVYRWLNIPMSGFDRGPSAQAPLALAGTRVAVNICYEDAFGDEIIGQLPAAEVLVNMTNVAWFGRSIAAAQHLQFSQLRAIETGRPMLRATNTGVTAIITPQGKVQAALPQFVRGSLDGTVTPMRGGTPYVRWGDAPILALCGALLIAAGWRRRVAR